MAQALLPEIIPHLILACGGTLILCGGAYLKKNRAGFVPGAALIIAVAAGLAAVSAGPRAAGLTATAGTAAYDCFFITMVLLIAALAILFSDNYCTSREIDGDVLYGLIIYSALGMVLIAGARHWLMFYLGLELLSISLYILIAINISDGFAAEAGIKYLANGMAASAILLFGIATLYAAGGSLDMQYSLAGDAHAGSVTMTLMGFCLIIAGIGFKLSLAPFHLWTADVYQGAPAPVAAFLSSGSKVAVFAVLLRMAIHAGDQTWSYIMPALWITAAVTMAAGTFAALTQTHVKRLLAYSSVAHMGYLMMALVAVRHQAAAAAVMFYLTAYAMMELGAFGTIALLSTSKADLDALDDFRGLGYAHPWRGALLSISLLSLAGLPPTAGFIGKFGLFQAAFQGKFMVLALAGIVTVIVSMYVYLKVIVVMFMSPAHSETGIPGLTLSGACACGLTLVLILIPGVAPAALFEVIAQALSNLSAP